MDQQQQQQQQQAIRFFNGLARAIGPDNLGMPVDSMAQALNLGLAGMGYAGHKLGVLKEPLPLIEKPVGGSDWIAEKLGNPDDGSGAYAAGRITPLLVSGIKGGGMAATRAFDTAITKGPAAMSKAAQRGAIRVSRGPGDNPDPTLLLSTSLNQELIPQLMTKGGNAELYSPSLGIKRGGMMSEFGDLTLIPRLGAFDPATSPSTLFNRDAYTARWRDFEGAAASKALRPKEFALKHTKIHDSDVVKSYLNREFPLEHVTYQGTPLSHDPEIAQLLDRFRQTSLTHSPEAAFGGLYGLNTDLYDPEHFSAYGKLYSLVSGLGGDGLAMLKKPADLRAAAKQRLADRVGLGIRPEDLRMNEGHELGMPFELGKNSYFHDLAMKTSPAFRSFQQYERSPLGAKLLKKGYANEDVFQQRVLEKAFGDQFGWMSDAAKRELIDWVPYGQGSFRGLIEDAAAQGVPSQTAWTYLNNGFANEHLMADLPGLYKSAALARRAIQHTPSNYAELKVLGSVPINADTFAGASTRGEALPEVKRAFDKLGIPLVERSLSATPEEEMLIAKMLQQGMAYGRQPAK